jgi:hypothetical protein
MLILSRFLFAEAYEFRRSSTNRQKVIIENQLKLVRLERRLLSKPRTDFAALQEAVRKRKISRQKLHQTKR